MINYSKSLFILATEKDTMHENKNVAVSKCEAIET
jgi:hypothetical protein